jgi:ubiquinone/menaquinone biosynthesis C-methylase UbiE
MAGDALTPREACARTRESYDAIAARFFDRSRDRTFLEAAFDRFAAGLEGGALVLDVGAGPGADSAELRRRGLRVISVDLSLGMLKTARDVLPGPRVQADMLRLPFGGVAQGLWVNASLLHLPRALVPAALRELRRVLRAPALLHVSVKQGTQDGWEDQRYGPEHPRWFTYWVAEAFDAALAGAGFRTVDARTIEGAYDIWLQRLVRLA